MKNNEGYVMKKSSIYERLTKYDEVKEMEEYQRLERERVEDNVIRQINELQVKMDALLFAVNCLLRSQTNTNAPNSSKKKKAGKSYEKPTKVENKGKRKKIDKS